MKVTEREGFGSICDILSAHGVKNAVLCPGSRNMPLSVAFSRNTLISCTSVIDERSAGFIALGKCEILNEPVAVVCTSGSALLNIAPAVAEAYYKKLPLIVISADRPEELIDQNDSQTINQPGILRNIVKRSYNIHPQSLDSAKKLMDMRNLNEAVLLAMTGPVGPVHINVVVPQVHEPVENVDEECKFIYQMPSKPIVEKDYMAHLAMIVQQCSKVLIVAGFNNPDDRLSKTLAKVNRMPNVMVMCENVSNLHLSGVITTPDSFLASLRDEERDQLRPDLLITFGGAIVSSYLKKWLRESRPAAGHWHVGIEHNLIDTFHSLTDVVNCDAVDFFGGLLSAMRIKDRIVDSGYKEVFHFYKEKIEALKDGYMKSAQWSDLKVMYELLHAIPSSCNLQLSNGMTIRNAMAFQESAESHRTDCNRGVSGIDGSTSTAVGAASVSSSTTILLTGDMSAQYDVGAFLNATSLTKNFKMVVFDNGGANIFKIIKATRDIVETDEFLYAPFETGWEKLAEAYGWNHYSCHDMASLKKMIPKWLKPCREPSMLIVQTDPDVNSKVYREFMKLKTQ